MLTVQAIIVFIALFFVLLSFYRNWAGPALTFFVAVMVFAVSGILSPTDILKSFANEQVAVVIILLLLGEIIRDLGIIQRWFDIWFRKNQNPRKFMAQMMLVVGGFSAFLNNTPLVAVMMPHVNTWSKRNKIAVSKLLIPLSYAAILGGCITLIGTSTNLIVNGMIVDQLNHEEIQGLEPFDLFDFSLVGIPMMIIGFLYLLFFSNKLLPEKKAAIDIFKQNTREYIVEALVKDDSHLIGKLLKDTGLIHYEDFYLYEIVRKNKKITSIKPDFILKAGDRLVFAGDVKQITELIVSNQGLLLPQIGKIERKRNTEIVEIVISHNSTLISKTPRQIDFRNNYDAGVIAIHRNGERVKNKLRNVKLMAGDTILLLASGSFYPQATKTKDFYIISTVKEFRKIPAYKSWILIGGTVVAVLLAAFKLVPLFTSLIVIIGVVSLLKIANPKDIASKVDFNLALTIIMALSFGTAMIKTGVAEMIASVVIEVFNKMGIIGMMFGIYLLTAVLAAYITNKAAVAITFPIALALCLRLGLNPEPFLLIVAFAAAANFLTPIGYQTNLMVYGPGGYNFKDFFKIGLPLTIIYMVVCVIILWFTYFYYSA